MCLLSDSIIKEVENLNEKDKIFVRTGTYNLTYSKPLLDTIAGIAGISLFIFACVAASGKFVGKVANLKVGYAIIGLSGGIFAFTLLQGDLKHKKHALAVTAAITAVTVLLGALGSAGIISAKQMGWGIIGSCLLSIIPKFPAERKDYIDRYETVKKR